MYDVTIIGGGPAGLTAELNAIHKGLKALLLTRDIGGKTNWRLTLPWLTDPIYGGPGVLRGLEMIHFMRSELGLISYDGLMGIAEKVRQTEAGFVVVAQTEGQEPETQEIETRAVIVATGTTQIPLGIPGEAEFFLRGLAYSALSYAPLFRDRTAAVIGDGELAIRSAAELAVFAKRVFLICGHREMLALPLGRKLASLENITVLDGYQTLEIKGDGEPGDGYARALVVRSLDGREEELEVDGTFIERGLVPNSGPVAELVSTDAAGRINVDATNCTNMPGIFAAGDVTHLYGENLLVAMGEGAKAALSVSDYLLEN